MVPCDVAAMSDLARLLFEQLSLFRVPRQVSWLNLDYNDIGDVGAAVVASAAHRS